MTDVEEELREILITDLYIQRERDQIALTHSLRNELGVDSVGFVELRQQIEQRFGVAISEEEFTPENFATISSLSKLIHRRRRDAVTGQAE